MSLLDFLIRLPFCIFFRCSNLSHLPSRILQLQHLDYLSVRRCPKLATNVRDERQSMLPIVSIEERRELLLSPPPANSSVSDVGCSSVGFPALTRLVLDKIFFSETLFPSTLEVLDISRSEIVSLPAWIRRFVRLKCLGLAQCKQLQEILEIPANIREISAGGCVSLESFPQVSKENKFKNTSQLPALELIDLSDCHKMAEKIGNEVEDSLLDKVYVSLLCMCLGLWVYTNENSRYLFIRTLLPVELYFLEIGYQTGSAIVETVHMVVNHV